MLKLTRLNHQMVAINPDHIAWVEVSPDTTLFLIGGDKIIVRESLDELIAQVVEFRRRIRSPEPAADLGETEGDPPRASAPPRPSRSPHRVG